MATENQEPVEKQIVKKLELNEILAKSLWSAWEKHEKTNILMFQKARALIQNYGHPSTNITIQDLVKYTKEVKKELSDFNRTTTELIQLTVKFARDHMVKKD